MNTVSFDDTQIKNSESELNVISSMEGSEMAPTVMVKPELQDNRVQDSGLNATSSPVVRRSGRTPVLPSKLRDMEVSVFFLRNTGSPVSESREKLSKKRKRKSSCQLASQEELSTQGISPDEIIVKVECAEEEEDNVIGDFVIDGCVELNTEMSTYEHPCVIKVELVETDEASANTVYETAGPIPLDEQSAQFHGVVQDAITCLPATKLNTDSQLAPSSEMLPHPETCMSIEDETPCTKAYRGLVCFKDTWFNHPAVPSASSVKRNCYYCHKVHKTVARTRMHCKTCKNYLCLNNLRNCMVLYHYGTLQPSFPMDLSSHMALNGACKIPKEKSPRAFIGGLTFPKPCEDIISITPLSHPPIPIVKPLKKKCWFCYTLEKKVRHSKFMCQICKRHYCLNQQRYCLVLHHDGRI